MSVTPTLSPTDLATYERNGYVFVPGLFSEQEIHLLRQEVPKILAEGRPGITLEKDGVTPRTFFNPQNYSPVFQRFVRDPRLVMSVMQLLKSQIYVFQLGLNFKAPFSGDLWWWHQDFPTYVGDDGIPTPRMVNCIIFVDEVTEFSGPLMLVPGSHVADLGVPEPSTQGTSYVLRSISNDDLRRLTSHAGLVAPKGPPGSVIFQHTNIVHGSTSNMSPWGRALMTLTYNSVHNKPTKQSRRPSYLLSSDMSALEPLEGSWLTEKPAARTSEQV
jgi:ectoine hydroxylase